MNASFNQDSISESSINSPSSPAKVEMVQTKALKELPSDSTLQPHVGEREEVLLWSRVRETCQDAFSEFFGTFILILFGDGVVAQVVLSRGTKGDYQSISWGWGGHPWRKLPIYAIAQTLGAMAAAAVVYGNYKSAIDAYEGGPGIRTVTGENATAGIFCTYPAAFMTRTGMVFSEFIASTILQFVIFALADSTNIGAGPLMPLALFFLIFGIGACWGWENARIRN